MPFIFPKRFLRTRDILDPREMNDDTRPVQELLDGSLDRHNFDASHLKTNLRTASIYGGPGDPLVGQFAYHNTSSASVECFYKIDRTPAGYPENFIRHPPNFVKPDGATVRDYPAFVSDAKGLPFVIPNTGEWSAVKNADLTDPMQVTFTSSRSRVWICAYVQYIWQGFYEWKPPWISTYDAEKAGVEGSDIGWGEAFGSDITRKERDVLNAFGPSMTWRSYINDYVLPVGSVVEDEYPYSFALNEPRAKDERKRPNLGGMHHISKGFYPALVQFALRIDGKIIDESITGKTLSFEESAHGLKIDDSPEIGEDEDAYVFGQRSSGQGMNYDDTADCRSGQKIRASRAVACGPEVMPVRIGAVVPIEPGEHTVEIVARRLQRKRLKFLTGDFVGVFSRRLVCVNLPMQAARQEEAAAPLVTPAYQTEDKVTNRTLGDARISLQDRVNAVEPQDLYRGVLPNTHLPSKVRFAESTSISNPMEIGDDGQYDPVNPAFGRSRARFPGFKNSSYIDRRVTTTTSGWPFPYTHAFGAGWYMLRDPSSELSITDTRLDVTAGLDELFLFADVDLRSIRPYLGERGLDAKLPKDLASADHRFTTQMFTSFIQQHKYLDLFALFALGYRVGSDWTIASEFVPAMVNSFNWMNRSRAYVATNIKGHTLIDASGYDKVTYPSTFSESPDMLRDRRGDNTDQSNLGINVPLFAHISGDKNIEEVAVFVSSTFPTYWDHKSEGHLHPVIRQWRDGTGAARGDVDYQWVSPAYNRDIISGLEVFFGHARLTAMKLTL